MKKIIVLIMALMLTGCGGVEPEHRTYPLVVGIDWQDERFQVIYGMPDLSISTGQGKSGEDTGSADTLLFVGEQMKDILQIYNRTQDKYLDLGHIQAVILGEKLLEEQEAYESILNYMEQDSAVGDSAAVFQCENPKELLELNGTDIESLGTYLTGIYENRLNDQRNEMVILRDLYRNWHKTGKGQILPKLRVKENRPEIAV